MSGTSPTRQHLALAVLLTASFPVPVDFSILNVALPAIGVDVGLALADLQRVATASALCAVLVAAVALRLRREALVAVPA